MPGAPTILGEQAPHLYLVQHAPGRTPGVEQLRSVLARLAVRCGVIIALVTIPLGWATFLSSNRHRGSIYLLIVVDLLVLLGLTAWLAWAANHTDGTLRAIARSARDTMLGDLRRLLPRDAREMVTADGQRAVDLYEQIASEPLGRVGRKSRLVAVIGTLTPTVVGLVKALSTVHFR
jgi:hypothetical protein